MLKVYSYVKLVSGGIQLDSIFSLFNFKEYAVVQFSYCGPMLPQSAGSWRKMYFFTFISVVLPLANVRSHTVAHIYTYIRIYIRMHSHAYTFSQESLHSCSSVHMRVAFRAQIYSFQQTGCSNYACHLLSKQENCILAAGCDLF